MDIRINKVEAVLLNIPRRSDTGHTTNLNLLIRIHTNTGITGVGSAHMNANFGETGPEGLLMVKEHYTPLLLNENPMNIELIMGKLDRFFYVAHVTTQAAVDIALHDIKGKALGVPVHQLLGGPVRSKVQLLAPQIQRGTPKEQSEDALRWVKEGFTAIKLKVGGSDTEEDVARVKEVRRTVGESIEIRIDANQYYDPLEAIKLINKLEPFDLAWVEDPVRSMRFSWDLEGLAHVHRKVNVPIEAGQLGTATDMLKVIRMQAVDCLKMKLVRGGGLLKSKKCIAIAEAANMSLVTGNGGDNDINFAAEVHLTASSPHLTRACESTGSWTMPEEFRLVKDPLMVKDGYVNVPDKPGLGVELIDVDRLEELIEKFPVAA